MRGFFSSKKFKIMIGILTALLLGVFVAAVSGDHTSPLSAALSFALKPLTEISVQIERRLQDFSLGFVSSDSYREEISSLQNELESCRSQMVDYEEIQKKLSSYEDFLGVKSDNPDFSFVPASVILRDASDLYASFTVNKGSANGISINDPVISGDNLVGVIRELTETTAVVYTMFSPSVGAAAYEIRTREDCYTESSADLTHKKLLKVGGLSRSTPVVAGGIICTSGIGGIFPKDLIIGTVSQVVASDADISTYALLKPTVDYSELTDVFIITDFNGKSDPS